jgi:hypothetical protein
MENAHNPVSFTSEDTHEDTEDVIALNELSFYELYDEFRIRHKTFTKADYDKWADETDTFSLWKGKAEKNSESFYTYLKEQGKYDQWLRQNYDHCVKEQWKESQAVASLSRSDHEKSQSEVAIRIKLMHMWGAEETTRAEVKEMDENSPEWAVELGKWYDEEEQKLKRTSNPTEIKFYKEKMSFIKELISIKTDFADKDWKRKYERLKRR